MQPEEKGIYASESQCQFLRITNVCLFLAQLSEVGPPIAARGCFALITSMRPGNSESPLYMDPAFPDDAPSVPWTPDKSPGDGVVFGDCGV